MWKLTTFFSWTCVLSLISCKSIVYLLIIWYWLIGKHLKASVNKLTKVSGVHSAPSFLSQSADIVAAAKKVEPVKQASFIDKIWNDSTKLTVYLAVWYLGNIYYNIYNKKACIALGKNAHGASNAHWALSAAQLFVGVLFTYMNYKYPKILYKA